MWALLSARDVDADEEDVTTDLPHNVVVAVQNARKRATNAERNLDLEIIGARYRHIEAAVAASRSFLCACAALHFPGEHLSDNPAIPGRAPTPGYAQAHMGRTVAQNIAPVTDTVHQRRLGAVDRLVLRQVLGVGGRSVIGFEHPVARQPRRRRPMTEEVGVVHILTMCPRDGRKHVVVHERRQTQPGPVRIEQLERVRLCLVQYAPLPGGFRTR